MLKSQKFEAVWCRSVNEVNVHFIYLAKTELAFYPTQWASCTAQWRDYICNNWMLAVFVWSDCSAQLKHPQGSLSNHGVHFLLFLSSLDEYPSRNRVMFQSDLQAAESPCLDWDTCEASFILGTLGDLLPVDVRAARHTSEDARSTLLTHELLRLEPMNHFLQEKISLFGHCPGLIPQPRGGR